MTRRLILTLQQAVLNGKSLPVEASESEMLVQLYRTYVGDYPKFFKMDSLCRLGFVAAEILLRDEVEGAVEERVAYGTAQRAVLLFGKHGCLATDIRFQSTIQDEGNYFPSPAIFVYTLPNIVTGEIAIRNKYYGETNFIQIETPDTDVMTRAVASLAMDGETESVLTGWIDAIDENRFEARMGIVDIHQDIEKQIKEIII